MTTETKSGNVSAVDFVKAAWEVKKSNGSVSDLAQKLGYDKVSSVHQRLANYRRKNIKLPEFPAEQGRRGLDIDALNKIGNEAEAKSDEK
jgi:hypothetical protein